MKHRNKEGYPDPTAGKAVERVSGCKKKKHSIPELTYVLGEIRGFDKAKQAVNSIKKRI